MKLLKLIIVLTGIFLCSLYVRLPFIDREVSPNNEAAITMLTVLKIWNSQGFEKSHFVPVLTWENKGDKFMANYKRLEDKSGNNYYVSFPPFAFILPYLISFILNVEPNQVFIQILNLLMHFFGGLLIYMIIAGRTEKNNLHLNFIGISGFIIYLFIPVLLFAHTYCFFPEIVGQLFFLSGILLFQKIEERKDNPGFSLLFLFGFNLFFLIYSEWLGLFYAFTVMLISLINYRKHQLFCRLFFITLLVSVFTLVLIFFQFKSISNTGDFFRSIALRFLERSGFFGTKYSDLGISYNNPASYIELFHQINNTLTAFGYFSIILLAVWLTKNKFPSLKGLMKNHLLYIIIFLPLMLEFLVFFNATVIHFVWWGRWGIPIAIGSALIMNHIIMKLQNKSKVVKYQIVFAAIILLLSVFSVYKFKNHSFGFSVIQNRLKKIGMIVKDHSKNDEAVFINVPDSFKKYNTYFSYISERSIINVADYQEAERIMAEKGKVKAVFYTFEFHSDTFTVRRIIAKQ